MEGRQPSSNSCRLTGKETTIGNWLHLVASVRVAVVVAIGAYLEQSCNQNRPGVIIRAR